MDPTKAENSRTFVFEKSDLKPFDLTFDIIAFAKWKAQLLALFCGEWLTKLSRIAISKSDMKYSADSCSPRHSRAIFSRLNIAS